MATPEDEAPAPLPEEDDGEPLAIATGTPPAAEVPERVSAAAFFGEPAPHHDAGRPFDAAVRSPLAPPPFFSEAHFGDAPRPAMLPRRLPRQVPSTVFFPRPPPPPERTLRRWAEHPGRLGLMFFLIGFFAVLVNQANLITQIVIGAPVFEEMFKFGLALILVVALGVRAGWARVVLALIPGVGFGVFEHATTYATEELAGLVFRVIFHAGTPALSMALYHAVEPVGDPRVRWGAPAPSVLIHWANNFLAVVFALVAVFLGAGGVAAGASQSVLSTAAYAVSSVLAVSTHVLAWSILAAEARVRGIVLRAWVHWAPREFQAALPRDLMPDAAADEPSA